MDQIRVGRRYLLEDAYADWKYKLADIRLNGHLDLVFVFKGKETTVREWFSKLQKTVTTWLQEARSAEIPDFEKTVSEYTSQATTPTSAAATDSLARRENRLIDN